MGVRNGLYCVSKETVNGMNDMSYDCFMEKPYEETDQLFKKDEIIYDTLNGIENAVLYDEKYSSKLFSDPMFDEDTDRRYRIIGKEQFRNIIGKILEHIAEYKANNKIVFDKETGKCIIGKKNWMFPMAGYGKEYMNNEILEETLRIQNSNDELWSRPVEEISENKTFHHFIDIDIDSKWTVSKAWDWQYAIFDFIHIYKVMDWEKDVIVIITE